MKRIPRTAWALLLILALFWGGNWPILKVAVSEVPVFWFRTVCAWGGAIGLLLIAGASGTPLAVPRRDWGRLGLAGILSIAGWNAFSGYGVLNLPVGRASMLAYTMPLWLVLLSVVWLKERLDLQNGLGLLLGMSGVALLIGQDFSAVLHAPVGTLCMLGAAISWAIGVAMIKKKPFGLPPTVQTAWMMVVGGLPTAALALAFESALPPPLSIAAWAAVAYNVAVAGVVCYWAFYKLVNMVPASVAGIASLIVPVVGMLTGMVFLGERPTMSDWIALALIVGALGVVLVWPHRADKGPA
ncbi:MAG TPA: DMT family transporter [Burkholderiales bacterium]